jgi:hypothetical protein
MAGWHDFWLARFVAWEAGLPDLLSGCNCRLAGLPGWVFWLANILGLLYGWLSFMPGRLSRFDGWLAMLSRWTSCLAG